MDLLNVDPQSRKVYSLCVNAFDLYLFHFARHLVPLYNPSVAWNSWNTLYYVLSCDYLVHFLPLEMDGVVLPVLPTGIGKTAYNIVSPSVSSASLRSPTRHSRLLLPHLFEQGVVTAAATTVPAVELGGAAMTATAVPPAARADSWRTESVVQLFVDTWLDVELGELPCAEYIRILRVLVKRLHAFNAVPGKCEFNFG